MNFLEPIFAAYQSVLRNPIMLLFTVLSALQVVQGFRRMNQLRARTDQPWAAEPFNRWRKQIGEDLSFYAAVPVSVLIHELGHAVVVWALGGRVLEFGFFFFWGYVLPSRSWGPISEWVLSSAGTWGNVLFAIAVWLALRNHPVQVVRYTMLRTIRFQIYFAFLYYPLFTAILRLGDWRTIYNFDATPMLSSGMAVVHVLILGVYWWLDRNGRFDMPAFNSAEAQARFAQLANEQTPSAQLQRLQMLQQGGLGRQADRLAQQLVVRYPDSAEIHLHAAFTGFKSMEEISQFAAEHARRALELGLREPFQRMEAHYILGGYYLRRNETNDAIDHYNAAIDHLGGLTNGNTHRLYYARGLALRRLGKDVGALDDLERAIRMARQHGQPNWAKQYENERGAFQQPGR